MVRGLLRAESGQFPSSNYRPPRSSLQPRPDDTGAGFFLLFVGAGEEISTKWRQLGIFPTLGGSNFLRDEQKLASFLAQASFLQTGNGQILETFYFRDELT